MKKQKEINIQSRKKNPSVKEHEIKLKKHNIHQKSCVQFKEDFLCVIHDKMDHSEIVFPWFQVKNKMVSRLG
jgi:hypothetical protein